MERAIGHVLRKDAPVHHFNENRRDNGPSNLVACEDDKYHMLLHMRQKALAACGNPSHLKCTICGTWDSPDEISTRPKGNVHPACKKANEKYYNDRRRARLAGR